jgi:hypothetical protein
MTTFDYWLVFIACGTWVSRSVQNGVLVSRAFYILSLSIGYPLVMKARLLVFLRR